MNAKQILQALATILPAYNYRTEQQRMVEIMEKALQTEPLSPLHRRMVVLEAPTGTGKTIAYLAAVYAAAKRQNRTPIIATATTTLQAQLVEYDIPLLSLAVGAELEAVAVKGRGRYACTRQVDSIASGNKQAELPFANVVPIRNRTDQLAAQKMLQALQQQLWNGDRDTWSAQISQRNWQQYTTDNDRCGKRTCAYFANGCPYYIQRRRIANADILVTNHDLLLTDANNGFIILPEPEDSLLIIDEAHQFHEKAQQHAIFDFDINRQMEALRFFTALIDTLAVKLLPRRMELTRLAKQIGPVISALHESLQHIEHYLLQQKSVTALMQRESEYCRLLPSDPILVQLYVHSGSQLQQAELLHKTIVLILQWSIQLVEEKRIAAEVANVVMSQLGGIKILLQQMIGFWQLLLNKEIVADEKGCWISADFTDKKIPAIVLHTAPVWIGAYLKQNIWDRYFAAVLLSATMRPLGDFKVMQRWAGLPAAGFAKYEVIPAPFRYAQQAELVIPWMDEIPGTDNDIDYFIAVAEYLNTVELQHGTLLLFTSKQALQQVWQRLDCRWKQTSLVQGESLSRVEIVARHRQNIDQGWASQIVGLQSFAEGLDLPGAYCRHVILTRLPFPALQHPLEIAQADWLRSRDRSPFQEISIPRCSMALQQACGRLLRHEDDYGRITLLDRRVVIRKSSYGNQLLQQLPPYRRVVSNHRPVTKWAVGDT